MSYLKIGDVGWSIDDTGFGNRFQLWAVAYEINKYNDFEFTILVEKERWGELKYLNFPYTEQSEDRFHILDFSNTIDLRKNWLQKLDVTKNYHLLSPDLWNLWPPYEVEKSFWDKHANQITIKDKSLEDKIKDEVRFGIGVHIRHWPMIEQINSSYFPDDSIIERNDYKTKMEKVKLEMKKFDNHKFYISSDCTYDEPGKGPLLPNFSMKHQWLSEIYDEFDVIDYRDIISIKDEISDFVGEYKVRDNNNTSWIKVLNIDEEGQIDVSSVYYEPNANISLFYDDVVEDLYDIKTKRDIVDLFCLIHSKELIESFKTGPFSSWTDFVLSYRDLL